MQQIFPRAQAHAGIRLPHSAPENEVTFLILLLSFAVAPPWALSLQHWPAGAELLQGVSTVGLVCTCVPLPYPPLHTALPPLSATTAAGREHLSECTDGYRNEHTRSLEPIILSQGQKQTAEEPEACLEPWHPMGFVLPTLKSMLQCLPISQRRGAGLGFKSIADYLRKLVLKKQTVKLILLYPKTWMIK